MEHSQAIPAADPHGGSGELRIRSADSFWSRFRGLMLTGSLSHDSALLLRACASVHTCFMRYAIDVLFLDAEHRIVEIHEDVRPWRACWPYRRGVRHVLELRSGGARAWGLQVGLVMTDLPPPRSLPWQRWRTREQPPARSSKQSGAAMVEFVVVGPVIALMGLGVLQYGMLYNAKNLINHASFMAARAGAMGNAQMSTIQSSYVRALIPLYGGGRTAAEIADSACKAQDAVNGTRVCLSGNDMRARIEIISPTRESFEDWNDPRLQALLNTGARRVIPNRQLAYRLGDRAALESLGNSRDLVSVGGMWVKSRSGQSLSDANILKIRITHGYEPKVPLMGRIYSQFLRWLDDRSDPFATAIITAGGIPVVSHVTVQMQTDAIESTNMSIPGMGNNGTPVDSGPPPQPEGPPPECITMGCSPPPPPPEVEDPDGSSGDCRGDECGACTGDEDGNFQQKYTLEADVLFEFGSAEISAAGQSELNSLIEEAHQLINDGGTLGGVTIVGFTDPIGSDADNQRLSEARANAVKAYLLAGDFPTSNITTEGRGEQELLVPMEACPQESASEQRACLKPNRRVEVTVTGRHPGAQNAASSDAQEESLP